MWLAGHCCLDDGSHVDVTFVHLSSDISQCKCHYVWTHRADWYWILIFVTHAYICSISPGQCGKKHGCSSLSRKLCVTCQRCSWIYRYADIHMHACMHSYTWIDLHIHRNIHERTAYQICANTSWIEYYDIALAMDPPGPPFTNMV